jgi:hypothetical protein
MNLQEKMIELRTRINALELKKSGLNKFAGFKYYELADFLPTVNELSKELKLIALFNLTEDQATLTIVNAEDPKERELFSSPTADAQVKGTTPVQSLGAVHTYLKRYLYMNFLELTEGDALDAAVGSGKLEEQKVKEEQKATEEQLTLLLEKLTPERQVKMLKYYKKESLEDLTITEASQALKKLNG